jgi:DNA-binding XRE family transcriptional regulator
MKSYIYVLKECNKSLIKIGKANDPHQRLTKLSGSHSFSPHESFVVEVEDAAKAFTYETSLHKMFENERNIQHGEGGTEFFNDVILNDVLVVVEIIAKNNNTHIDKDYFKRFFVGVDNPIYKITESDKISLLLVDIGDKCKSLRLNKNITQEELADACDLAVGTIKAAEKGKVKLENLLKMMLVLGDDTLFNMLDYIEVPFRSRSRTT